MPPKPKGLPSNPTKPEKAKSETITKTYKLHKIQHDFHHSGALYRGYVGGIGCTAPETLLGGVPIGDLTSSAGECRTLLGDAPRSPSFCKGKADLYRVTMESGRTVTVTLKHRFLTPEGWLPLSKLRIGSLLAADGSEDAIDDLEKPIDLKGDYLKGLRRDDVQLHPIQAFYSDKIRQSFERTSCNRSIQSGICHPSIGYSSGQMRHPDLSSELFYHASESFCELLLDQHHTIGQGQLLTFHQGIALQHRPLATDGSGSLPPCQRICHSYEEFSKPDSGQCQVLWQQPFDSCEYSTNQQLCNPYSLLKRLSCIPYTNSFWDKVQDISFVKNGEFYDLTVPGLEHYSAAGLYHHNSGKSWIGAYDILRRAMSEDGKGRLYMVIAPTYNVLQDATMRTIYQIADDMGVTKEKWKQPPRLVLANGSEIIFRSGEDPDKLRGPNISGIWLDEASVMDEEVFNICIGRLREGGRAGWLTATFTPKGMIHWTYEVFGRGDRENTELFRSKTSQNPFLAREFVSAVSKQYSDKQANQELDGEFVDQEGAEWPNSHFGESIWFEDWPHNSNIKIKTMAVDPSKGRDARHGDYTSIVKLARDQDGVLYCDATMRRMDSEHLVAMTVSEAAQFDPDGLGIETNQFQHLLATQILEESKKQGNAIPIMQIYNNISKDVRIRRLGPYLANKLIKFKRNEGTRLLVAQLREFPLGKHDDGPDALEMALRTMISLWNGKRNPQVRRITA